MWSVKGRYVPPDSHINPAAKIAEDAVLSALALFWLALMDIEVMYVRKVNYC